jgi:hypothetical protein
LTPERADARARIIQTANRDKLRRYRRQSRRIRRPEPRLYGPRQINEAVAHVRNRRLVKPEVLEAAGFRAHGPNLRTRSVPEARRLVDRLRGRS